MLQGVYIDHANLVHNAYNADNVLKSKMSLDNGTNTTVCMGGNKSSAGSKQNGGETPWMSLPKEKKAAHAS